MSTQTGYAEMFEWADGGKVIGSDGKEYIQNRIGYSVVIDKHDKIRLAVDGDTPFGIVAADNTAVQYISGASVQEWHGKHERDPFKKLLWEKQEMIEWIDKGFRHWYERDRIPAGITPPPDAKIVHHWPVKNGEFQTYVPLMREVISKRYSENTRLQLPYKPRFERPEWAIVVIMGRAILRSNSAYNTNWIKLGVVGSNVSKNNLSTDGKMFVPTVVDENYLFEYLVR
jgi:hypothetical protein